MEEFKSQQINTKKIEEGFKKENSFADQIENIKEVFRLNSELEKIGNPDEYAKYLETIFPESKIKDIVWHGTRSKEDFDNFIILSETKEKEGAFFSRGLRGSYLGGPYKTMACKLDINPYYVELKDRAEIRNAGDIRVALKEKGWNGVEFERKDLPNEIQVYDSDQIYILGSKKDIENFKNWVENQKKEKK